jgi:OOP family OmpA-OmpF porin
MLKKLALTLCLCSLSLPAVAALQSGGLTLSPMVGGHLFDGDQSLDQSSFFGLGLGYNLTENWAVEGIYTRTDADAEDASSSDAEVETFRLEGLYHFRPTEKLVPYLAAGVGGIYSDFDNGENQDHLLFNYGIGIKYFILDDLIALRADVRHLLDFPEPDHNLQYSAGLVFQLGRAKAKPEPVTMEQPEPEPEPQPTDRDGDGVYDQDDQCPGTPAGAPVDNDGCPLDSDADGVFDYLDDCPGTPAGAAVDQSGCPLDADGDGVYDYRDRCPDTPQGAPVNSRGCPLDSDGDGVFDYLDQCPGTPVGVSVNATGCPTVLTLRINFPTDSSLIEDKYDDEIAKAAQCIQEYPGNVVFVDGHTDNVGAAEYNQQLSQRRAAAVAGRLTAKFGIPAKRMTTRGFGEEKPVADNSTPTGRALNRRVEVACGAK